jgi:hypothetical protein
LLFVGWVLFNMYRNAFIKGDDDPSAGMLHHWLGLSSPFVFILGVLAFGAGIATGAVVQKEGRLANGRVVSPSERAGGRAASGDPKIAARTPGPPFRLQGIFYNSKQSSAIVNGQTLLVGGQLGAWRVTAIEPRMVTLESPAGEVEKLALK